MDDKAARVPIKAKEEEPTKIVVHITAAEEEKKPEAKAAKPAKKVLKKVATKAAFAESSESSLFEKLNIKTPVFQSRSLSSAVDDNDDFQGSVFEFENKVASSKQMLDDQLSGANKI